MILRSNEILKFVLMVYIFVHVKIIEFSFDLNDKKTVYLLRYCYKNQINYFKNVRHRH